MAENKIVLSEKDIPRQWYNVLPDLPSPLPPPLHPGTHQPGDLAHGRVLEPQAERITRPLTSQAGHLHQQMQNRARHHPHRHPMDPEGR